MRFTRKHYSWLIQACDDYLAGVGDCQHIAGFCYYFDEWCDAHGVEFDDWAGAYALVGKLREHPALAAWSDWDRVEGEWGRVDPEAGPTPRRLEFVAAMRKLVEEELL